MSNTLTQTLDPQAYQELITGALHARQQVNHTAGAASKAAALVNFATSETVYILSIKLSVGSTRVALPWETIRIRPELITGLNQAGAACPSVDLFRGLAKRGGQLKTRKEFIQTHWLQSGGGFWFCREQDLPAVAAEIAEMQAFADELRAELADIYDQEFTDYLGRIATVLAAASIPPDEARGIVNQFAARFPTLADAQAGFGFVIDGPYRVPSLLEQAQGDNKVASELLQSEELKALQELQHRQVEGIASAVADCVAVAQDEIYGLIAEQLQRLEALDVSKLGNHRSMRSAIETCRVLQRKLDFSGSLADVVAQVDTATQVARKGNQAALQETLDQIKKRLGADLDTLQSSGKTVHKKLSSYMLS